MFRLLRLRAVPFLLLLVLLAACGGRPIIPTGISATQGDTSGNRNADVSEAFVPGKTGNWLLEQDDVGSSAIVNEELVITIAAPNTMQYAALDGATFSDLALEVDVAQRSGPADSSYGVLFRMEDDQQFYRFDITGNGLYVIERRNSDSTWTRLTPDWTPTTALNQGLNTVNRLKVIAAGPDLTFYANDVLLTQLSDPTFSSGGIALDAGTFGGGNLQVSFDNLAVTAAP